MKIGITPTAADGFSCDLSAVEECADWITPPFGIRSTVIPGTVDRLAAHTGKAIAFSPEYLGSIATIRGTRKARAVS
jgi:hypothetical protein